MSHLVLVMADNIENCIVEIAEIGLIVVIIFDMMLMIEGISAIFVDKLSAVSGIVGLEFHALAFFRQNSEVLLHGIIVDSA